MPFLPIPPLTAVAPILTLAKIGGRRVLWTGEPMYVLVHFIASGKRTFPRPCLATPECRLCHASAEVPVWQVCIPALVEMPRVEEGACRMIRTDAVVALPSECMHLFGDYGTFRGHFCRLHRLSPTKTKRESLDADARGLPVRDPVSCPEVLCARWGYPRESATVETDQYGRQIIRFCAPRE